MTCTMDAKDYNSTEGRINYVAMNPIDNYINPVIKSNRVMQ